MSALAFLDFSSVFYTIHHSIFVRSLHTDFEFMILSSNGFHLVSSYRTQFVSVLCSALAHVHSGVPQGSALDPIFFSMYIKPMSTIIDSHSITLHTFADD